MDLSASFKITAGVVGQAAVDQLNKSVGTLNTGIGKLPGIAKTAGLAMAGLGAGLSFAVFKDKFDGVVETMLKVKDAAEKTGSSVEKIGGIFQAAKITGDDWGTIEGAIIKMDKALHGADDGAKGAAQALAFLGLKADELRRMDPADAFDTIAGALSKVQDGSGKSAIAMDLFGKSGAQVLPFLKDYVEIGAQASKVTAQQAEDAEAYNRATLKLAAAKQELYKVLSTQLLPVATDFVQALLDVTNGTNGVKDAAKGLAADGSMRDAFREGARAAAAFMDIMSDLLKVFAQVASSARVVYHDIGVAAAAANFLNPLQMGKQLLTGGNQIEDFKKILAERNRVVEEANKSMVERWGGSLTPYSDALEKRFAQRDVGAGGGRGSANDPRRTDAPRSAAGYTSRAPTDGKGGGSGSNPYGNALDSLGQEAAKLQEQIYAIKTYGDALESAKGAQARFQTEQGKFKDLSEKQKLALVMQADAVDRLAQEYKDLKTAAEFDKQTEAIDANTSSLFLNTRERELAAAGQDLENKGIKRGSELYDELMRKRAAALDRKDDAMADPMNGIKGALAELADRGKDVAGQVKSALVNAFDRAGDALGEFLTTGKLDFKEFASSILADLAKMIAKQALFNALAAVTGGGGGSSGGFFSAITSLFGFAKGGAFDGSLQAFAQGGVVNSATPFRFASGGSFRTGVMGEAGPEAIMPLARGADGKLGVKAQGQAGGGGISIGSIVVQGDGGAVAQDTSGKKAAELGRDLAQTIDQRILHHRRPGGLLAA